VLARTFEAVGLSVRVAYEVTDRDGAIARPTAWRKTAFLRRCATNRYPLARGWSALPSFTLSDETWPLRVPSPARRALG